jgi:hypothetical protein
MLSQIIIDHLHAVAHVQSNPWDVSVLSSLAGRYVPDVFFGDHSVLIRGDMGLTWGRWFIEGLCDPEVYVEQHSSSYPHIFSVVFRRVGELFPTMPHQERMEVARHAAKMVHDEAGRRQAKRRVSPTKKQKQSLWAAAKPGPRCYLCGHRFGVDAENLFLGHSTISPTLPLFVDFVKLRGINDRHLCVEVDHVQAVAHGGLGGSNFRLACGWCNVFKSSKTSVYDDDDELRTVTHPRLGKTTIPKPFWIVRLLAMRGQCEWPGGCDKTVQNAELTVVPRRRGAAMNPTNLRVTCENHDDFGADRLVALATAISMKT